MATIHAIDAASVHHIQSGQVIVDLNSVAKELVENSLDAGATSIDVRFRNYGLDSVEVSDNGTGIAPEDYAFVARKHHTSKLHQYTDIDSLATFGFRGEALASLCALANTHVITARAEEQPRGTKLEFAPSGELLRTSVVAAQRGTKVVVADLFHNLPVRRRELARNVKREYGKVLALLQAYACVCTGVRFVVSNQTGKSAQRAVAFATTLNASTRDNITNVFGARTTSLLVPLELRLEMSPTTRIGGDDDENEKAKIITVRGHVSRPVSGHGRQTPDRQLFFVNARPCTLPQVAKAFNEVYKSFNVSQSPFVFADLVMDTAAYDVNVSPDKRTIMLHEQGALLEKLKVALHGMFENEEQVVPAQRGVGMLGTPSLSSRGSVGGVGGGFSQASTGAGAPSTHQPSSQDDGEEDEDDPDDGEQHEADDDTDRSPGIPSSDRQTRPTTSQTPVQNAFDRLRTPRLSTQTAMITIGDEQPRRRIIGSASGAGRTRSKVAKRDLTQGRLSAFLLGPERGESPVDEGGSEEEEEVEEERGEEEEDEGEDEEMEDEEEEREERRAGSGEESDTGMARFERSAASARAETDSDARERDDEMEEEQTRELRESAAVSSAATYDDNNDHDNVQLDTSHAGHGSSRRLDPDSDQDMADVAAASDQSEDDDVDVEEERVSSDDLAIVEQTTTHTRATPGRRNPRPAPSDPITLDEVPQATPTTIKPNKFSGSGMSKHSTVRLLQHLDISVADITRQAAALARNHPSEPASTSSPPQPSVRGSGLDADSTAAEARLNLTVDKGDFREMAIAGQFNLGFILAVRAARRRGRPADTAAPSSPSAASAADDDLFIIDQHAADEKYNFERLSNTLRLAPQRLAQPKRLLLTAIEEEIVLSQADALALNGFELTLDETRPVGERCMLVALPTSKETTFDLGDLEELIHLLSEHVSAVEGTDGTQHTATARFAPRPSKVRKMLAMRACRSSIMVGKTLTGAQMRRVVGNLAGMDKPWNCPHGRPTMRHLTGLRGWREWDEWQDWRGGGDDGEEDETEEEDGAGEDGEGEGDGGGDDYDDDDYEEGGEH